MGLICWLSGVYGLENEYTGLQVVNIFAHRAALGFVIGISVLRMDWATGAITRRFREEHSSCTTRSSRPVSSSDAS